MQITFPLTALAAGVPATPLKNSLATRTIEKLLARKGAEEVKISVSGKRYDKTIKTVFRYDGYKITMVMLHVSEDIDGGDSNTGDVYFIVNNSPKQAPAYVVSDGSVLAMITDNVKQVLEGIAEYSKQGKVVKKYVQKQNKSSAKPLKLGSDTPEVLEPRKLYIVNLMRKPTPVIIDGPYSTDSVAENAAQHMRGEVYSGQECLDNGWTWQEGGR